MTPELEAGIIDAARRVAAGRAAAEERDRLIVEAFEEGAPLREIARAAGVTHPRVLAIVRKRQAG